MIGVSAIGARTLGVLRAFGHAAFFFAELVRAVPASLRRFGLVVAQIHAIGNLSLVIILSSGLAVGFVLALADVLRARRLRRGRVARADRQPRAGA